MSKYEGLKFLYDLGESMGWDNLDFAELEVIMATVHKMETDSTFDFNIIREQVLNNSSGNV